MTVSSFAFRIASDHPALPGHFPDRPIVPAVVLVDHISAQIGRTTHQAIAHLHQVKFLNIARPEEDIEVSWELSGTSVSFNGVALRGNESITLLFGQLVLRPMASESQ
jgi:3-hydroxymyristoyl/3-hydroxydecanoyl-(acyl carrier protein) dehydratase